VALDASELAQIQADLAATACDKTCDIQRSALTKDIYGNPVRGSYTTVATVKAAMAQPTANQLTNFAFRIESLAAWQVKFPYGTDVRVDDHLIIENNTLNVHVLLDPHTVPGLLTVIAAELKP
jgi:hypothetical protein